MSGVNVLAVMDEMIDCYGSVEECPDDTEFLVAAREARAAVAELIEANRELLTTIAKSVSILRWEQLKVAVDHTNAALARVGGA